MLNVRPRPLGLREFLSNVMHSYDYTKYRIDRVPRYELIRCGLDVPELPQRPVHWHAGDRTLVESTIRRGTRR